MRHLASELDVVAEPACDADEANPRPSLHKQQTLRTQLVVGGGDVTIRRRDRRSIITPRFEFLPVAPMQLNQMGNRFAATYAIPPMLI
jgi:hypothetical protein